MIPNHSPTFVFVAWLIPNLSTADPQFLCVGEASLQERVQFPNFRSTSKKLEQTGTDWSVVTQPRCAISGSRNGDENLMLHQV